MLKNPNWDTFEIRDKCGLNFLSSGRLYNIATPANQCVQQLGNMVVQSGMEPGSGYEFIA